MRRIEVECSEGHREEIIIKADQKIPRCSRFIKAMKAVGSETKHNGGSKCNKKREIIWRQSGAQGAPGFRVQGLTKRF